jgi:hydroxymethylpyrimidine pyrophosphatase-like HAD family hydrolase
MRIRALFCDYDGTLAPLGVQRSNSRVPRPLSKALFRIHQRIPVAIVTAKDYDFVRRRTPFADAWSCVYGIETVLKDGTKKVVSQRKDMSRAITIVEAVRPRPFIEYKKTSSGRVCGFCAEWDPDESPEPIVIDDIICKIRRSGLQVVQGSLYPIIDVISSNGDKGMAVKMLQSMLGTRGGVMFVGDSSADNSAFAVASVAIGLVDKENRPELKCDYSVRRDRLSLFLLGLLQNDLRFSEGLPWIVRRKATK